MTWRKRKISFAFDYRLFSFELIGKVQINFNIIYASFWLLGENYQYQNRFRIIIYEFVTNQRRILFILFIHNKCSRNNKFFLFSRLNISNNRHFRIILEIYFGNPNPNDSKFQEMFFVFENFFLVNQKISTIILSMISWEISKKQLPYA